MDKEYMNKGCYMGKRDQSTCQPNSDVGDKEVWREIHQERYVVESDLGQHIRHQTTQVEENLDIIRHLLEHLAI